MKKGLVFMSHGVCTYLPPFSTHNDTLLKNREFC